MIKSVDSFCFAPISMIVSAVARGCDTVIPTGRASLTRTVLIIAVNAAVSAGQVIRKYSTHDGKGCDFSYPKKLPMFVIILYTYVVHVHMYTV